jgi:hypothetical protein
MLEKNSGHDVSLHVCTGVPGGDHIHLITVEGEKPYPPFWDKMSLVGYLDFLVDMKHFPPEHRDQALALLEGINLPSESENTYDMISMVGTWNALHFTCFGRPHFFMNDEVHILHCNFVQRAEDTGECIPFDKNFKICLPPRPESLM